jgi:hypothetical protein
MRASLTYVRGEEVRYSGCGMPASPIHFHLVIASSVKLNGQWLGGLWQEMAGKRTNGAGADMRQYDPSLDGISYVLKFLRENHGDWTFRNLHLVLPEGKSTSRSRRRHHRNESRFQLGNHAMGVTRPVERHENGPTHQ